MDSVVQLYLPPGAMNVRVRTERRGFIGGLGESREQVEHAADIFQRRPKAWPSGRGSALTGLGGLGRFNVGDRIGGLGMAHGSLPGQPPWAASPPAC
jgi:hypothetical protein